LAVITLFHSSSDGSKAPPLKTVKAATSINYATNYASIGFKRKSNKLERVSVCYAYSPTEFYIQYSALEKQLTNVNERVRKSVAHAEPLIDPVAGLPCLALFPENGEWYRAQVLQVLPAGIRVQFVDYGNLMTIPNCHTSYRRMKQSLSDCPIYAAKVKLAGVLRAALKPSQSNF
jgi:hypothetical protein